MKNLDWIINPLLLDADCKSASGWGSKFSHGCRFTFNAMENIQLVDLHTVRRPRNCSDVVANYAERGKHTIS